MQDEDKVAKHPLDIIAEKLHLSVGIEEDRSFNDEWCASGYLQVKSPEWGASNWLTLHDALCFNSEEDCKDVLLSWLREIVSPGYEEAVASRDAALKEVSGDEAFNAARERVPMPEHSMPITMSITDPKYKDYQDYLEKKKEIKP